MLNNISIRSRTYARESLRARQVCLFIMIFLRHVLRGSRTLPWYKLKMILRFAWETFCFKSKSLLIRKFHKFTARTQCVHIKVYFTVWQFLWFSWLRHYKHIWINQLQSYDHEKFRVLLIANRVLFTIKSTRNCFVVIIIKVHPLLLEFYI